MKYTTPIAALVLAAVLRSTATCQAAAPDELFVAFWNVENLFDTVDDPKVEKDEEFTPTADKKWTQTRLEIKLTNLARVICDMNEGRGPDVLGLSEVENRRVVELLVAKLAKLNRRYDIVHQDSPSFRGIDCALIYDQSVCKLAASKFHRIDDMTTRDIVEARVVVDDRSLTVFVNHWPSRYNPDAARVKVAGVLRQRVDELLAANAATDIVIIGDLNDTPANISVSKTLAAVTTPVRSGRELYDLMGPIHDDPHTGTYVYKNKWGVLDHVIVSPGLLNNSGFALVQSSGRTILKDYQLYVPRKAGQIPKPSRSYTGPYFHQAGYSDHLPVACRLRVCD